MSLRVWKFLNAHQTRTNAQKSARLFRFPYSIKAQTRTRSFKRFPKARFKKAGGVFLCAYTTYREIGRTGFFGVPAA